MTRNIEPSSNYQDKLLMLIPAEIVAAYLALEGIAGTMPGKRLNFLIVVILILLVINYFYLSRIHHVQSRVQILVTELSFLVWVFSLGGPFLHFLWYDSAWGSAVVIIWTLVIPLFQISPDEV